MHSNSWLLKLLKKLRKFSLLPGFTLVELIVVISILAVLGTIGFIGLQGYSKSSRDSNRVTSVRTLVSGLSLYVIQSGKYPSPEGAVSTGSIGGVNLVYKGEVGSNIASLIRHSDKAPKDPLANTAYAYGISADGKYYQIGATLENLEALNGDTPTLFVDTAYAASPLKARVDGNYLGYLKFLSGSETWIANIPSLIYSNTGSVSLDASNTNVHYVINGDTNLPYPVGGEIAPVPKTPNEVVKTLWKDSSATLTGVNITGVTNSNTLSSVFTGATLASFGGNIGSVEQVVLGTSGSSGGGIGVSGGASCTLSGTTVAHGATITGYSETNILYSAAYDCTSRQLSRTCSNGTLSGDASYQYASCVKGTVNNCTANSSYTYNSHTYSLPAITHGSSATNIISTAVSQNHGSFTYTLTNATCNDGVIGSVTENATPSVVSCESGYGVSGNSCVASQAGVCNNAVALGCTTGTATADNGLTTCGTTRTWKCSGVYGGSESAVCSLDNGSCRGEKLYTTPGSHNWTVPAGVTSVSVVCVGGGGAFGRYNETYYEEPNYFRYAPGLGGGGGLGWKNSITVVPGNSYPVVIGTPGIPPAGFDADPTNGGDSYFINTSIIKGGGGGSGLSNYQGGAGGTYVGDGGGSGGKGGNSSSVYPGTGGGAGGYAGNGAAGRNAYNNSVGTAGSGGGGGSASDVNGAGSLGGGGVGLYGIGSNGAAGLAGAHGGGGGSGGANGGDYFDTGTPTGCKGGAGGTYGGASGAGSYGGRVNTGVPLQALPSGGGACRIIWPGTTRQFPSTDVGL